MKEFQKKIVRVILFLGFYGIIFHTNFLYSQKKSPPNIIVFLVDDMGVMDTSVPFLTDENGNLEKYPLNDFYQTPNMEKLAEQGIRFSNFQAHSVCSPTRISIITGQNSSRHRTTNWISPTANNKTKFGPSNWNWKGISKSTITLPKLLQKKGYKTIHVGKAHFGPFHSESEDPKNIGFDVNIGGNAIGRPTSYLGTDGFGHIKGDKLRAVPGLKKYHGKDIFLTEALTLEAKKELSKAKKENKPFFLNMSHYAVHAPFNLDVRFAEKYKNSGKSKKAQAFATLIEGVDKSLGDIVQHVKDLGLGENTLILFLGDNGSDAPLPKENNYSSSSPLKGKKGTSWEGGMRVPFIASWIVPNKKAINQQKTPIAKNAVQLQMGTILDIFPTLCNVAEVNNTNDIVLDGFNLEKQFLGQKNINRDEVFVNHFPHHHNTSYYTSLVKSNWKVIYYYPVNGTSTYELFNLKKDPFETTNLASKNPKQLKFMMELLVSELKDKNALYPEINNTLLQPIIPN